MKPLLYDITPFTLLDYPGHVAAIFWFPGCNMRCAYCYNPHIVWGKARVSEKDALAFLQRRRSFLQGVVMSGGECTLHPRLPTLCQEIASLGLRIKVDTNGSRPEVIQRLLITGAVHFISLDFKAPQNSYKKVTHAALYKPFLHTLRLLIESETPFEVRTTFHHHLLSIDDLTDMRKILIEHGYRGELYVQQAVSDAKYLMEDLPPHRPLRMKNDLPGIVWRT